MNAIVTAQAIDEAKLIEVLTNSLYPGAAPDSVRMVLGYCTASNLDPMQKPVHIVPMWDGKAGKMRDVVMPGVGLYRTQAARTGCAGISEPEFGPDKTERVGGQEITFPSWCRVTVKRRQANGAVDDFTAREFWMENYATKGKDSSAPNAMWARRPYAQLAKCAEAQALRKAFPEVGSQPTADEMEGKALDMGMAEEVHRPAPAPAPAPAPLAAYPADLFERNLPTWAAAIRDGRNTVEGVIAKVQTKGLLSAEQQAAIRAVQRAETIDADTGEIVGTPAAPSVPSPREVDAALRAAQTLTELDAAAHGITTAPESAQEALIKTYNACRAEITGA